METAHLRYVYKHFRFLGHGGVNLKETEHYAGHHGRAYHWRRGTPGWQPSVRGGYTFCYVYDETGGVVATGRADCSKLDHFCYHLGREIARGRALKSLEEPLLRLRTTTWDAVPA